MAPGPTRTADIDRPRLSNGIFLLVGCACDGNDNSDPLCHHDLAAGNRDRRCEHGSGFADQALGLISQLARIPELLFDAAIDRISNRRWRNCPCLLLSSLQSLPTVRSAVLDLRKIKRDQVSWRGLQVTLPDGLASH